MSKELNQRNDKLATKFNHLDWSSVSAPLDFKWHDNEDMSNHVKEMLAWLKAQNQCLSIPDFVDLLAFHNNVSYEALIDKGGWSDFFWLNDDFFNPADGEEYQSTGRIINHKYQDDSDGDYYLAVTESGLEGDLRTETDYRNHLIIKMACPTKLASEPSKITSWTNTDDFRDIDQRKSFEVVDWFTSNSTNFSKSECEDMAERFHDTITRYAIRRLQVV